MTKTQKFVKAILANQVEIEKVNMEKGIQEFIKLPKAFFEKQGIKFSLNNAENFASINQLLKSNDNLI